MTENKLVVPDCRDQKTTPVSKRKKLLLVINPVSGTLSKEGLEQRVRGVLSPRGFDVEAVTTTRSGEAGEIAARAAEEGVHGVLVAGGDGTVNEAGNALRSTQTALGILPFGSGNGLARHLGLSIDVDHALSIIAKDNVTACDYGTVNGDPFFCTFGLGFDAKVSHEFAHMPGRGLMNYIKSAAREYLSYSPGTYEISTEGHTLRVKAFLVAACNASQYGNNAFIAPTASVHDGLLDITVVHAGNPITRAMAGMELFTGRIDKNILIQTWKTRSAVIRHLPGPGHLDGEPRMMPETLEVMCHPGCLRMFTDPDKPEFRAYRTPIDSLREDTAYLMRENLRQSVRNVKSQISEAAMRFLKTED